MNHINVFKRCMGASLLMSSLFALLLTTTSAQAALASGVSFGLDDNPKMPLGGVAPVGTIIGVGAEDPFGLGGGSGLAPSPSLIVGAPTPKGDGAILNPGPLLQHTGPALVFPKGGYYIDSFSSNHADNVGDIQIKFSVDRLSTGLSGTAVLDQTSKGQQPGDIFESTKIFTNPAIFIGSADILPGFFGSYGGSLPTVDIGGPGSNSLFIDEGSGTGAVPGLGLKTAGGLVVDETVVSAGPITGPLNPDDPGSHDNVDSFDLKAFSAPESDGVFNLNHHYFTIYPDEAAGSTLNPADIFVAPLGSSAALTVPYATATSMGLSVKIEPDDPEDSIDGLVIWDLNNTPENAISIEPGIDYALFSLSPGSASLTPAGGLSAADVFFTDFSGKFWRYASGTDLGLLRFTLPPFGAPIPADNIDALEINLVATPVPALGLWTLLGLLLPLASMRRKLKAKFL